MKRAMLGISLLALLIHAASAQVSIFRAESYQDSSSATSVSTDFILPFKSVSYFVATTDTAKLIFKVDFRVNAGQPWATVAPETLTVQSTTGGSAGYVLRSPFADKIPAATYLRFRVDADTTGNAQAGGKFSVDLFVDK